jgi:hypothetical protein
VISKERHDSKKQKMGQPIELANPFFLSEAKASLQGRYVNNESITHITTEDTIIRFDLVFANRIDYSKFS